MEDFGIRMTQPADLYHPVSLCSLHYLKQELKDLRILFVNQTSGGFRDGVAVAVTIQVKGRTGVSAGAGVNY